MKIKFWIIILFFLIPSNPIAQEICDNAVDDDLDGKIDLNDIDCRCADSIPSSEHFLNPSFEYFQSCLTGNSMIYEDAVKSWHCPWRIKDQYCFGLFFNYKCVN